MNEAIITSTKIPRRLRVTKILSYLFLISTIFNRFIRNILNIISYFASSDSAIKIACNTDYGRFYIDGPLGYIRLPFNYLAITASDFPIENAKLFAVSLALLFMIAIDLPILFMLIQACRLLREITSSYTPFTEKTTKLIRSVGIIMLLRGFLGILILQMGINLINFHRIGCDNPFDVTWILIGLFVLILADVFYKGCLLQQDADETL